MKRELKDILIAHGVYGEENLDEAVDKILLLSNAVGRSEQFYCFDEKNKRIDRCVNQCDTCKELKLMQ